MSFDALIRQAVQIAHTITGDGGLHVSVTHEAIALDGDGQPVTVDFTGEPTFETAVVRSALWEDEAQLIRQVGGIEVAASGRLTFLVPGLVIDERDRLTFNGKTPAILRVDRGLRSDDGTYVLTVWLGTSNAATAGGQ